MLERVCRAWFDLAAVLLAVAILGLPSHWLTDRFFFDQDLPLLVGFLVAAGAARLGLSLAGRRGQPLSVAIDEPSRPSFGPLPRPGTAAIGLAVLCGVVALGGSFLVYENYALSLDVFMVRFDQSVLAGGAPMAHVPPQWRDYLPALQPQFTRSTADHAFWSSTYLPVNAALRAVAGPAEILVGPVLAAICVVAVFGVGRRLWPERPGVSVNAALLLATSSQFLITAMTPYAMTAHLACNLVWLWLFLRGGRFGHAGALAVGFLACGLHQLVFHPLFVAPFLIQLGFDRRWRLMALYILAYAAICLFWVNYDDLTRDWIAAAGPAAALAAKPGGSVQAAAGVGGFAGTAAALLKAFDPGQIGVMAKNLIRFVTWQNPLTAPLVLLGAVGAMRAKGAVRSMLLGLILTMTAMYVLLPYQGHGWGYRYLHGVLGSACLLAAWTWSGLVEQIDPSAKSAAARVFVAAAALSVGILLPIRAIQTHDFVHPYAAANRAIRARPEDVVLVDDQASLFTVDLARNDPYLRGHPVVFRLAALSADQIRTLCAAHPISVFDRADAARFGIQVFASPVSTPAAAARLSLLRTSACGMAREPIRDLGGRPLG